MARSLNQPPTQEDKDIESSLKLRDQLEYIKQMKPEEQLEKLPLFIEEVLKVDYVEGYELLEESLEEYNKVVPHPTNLQDPKLLEQAYKFEKICKEAMLGIALNIDKWKSASGKKLSDQEKNQLLQNFHQKWLVQNSRTQELLNSGVSVQELQKHNIPPLMDQSLFEVSQILAINNTDPSIIKSLSNQISDPQKKQELVSVLFDIENTDEEGREMVLKNIAFQNPGIKELVMERVKSERIKNIIQLRDQLEYIKQMKPEEQLEKLPLFIEEVLKVDYVEGYELLEESLEEYNKVVPHPTNLQDPKLLEQAYKFEKICKEAMLGIALNIDKWKSASGKKLSDQEKNQLLQNFHQKWLVQNSRTQELLNSGVSVQELQKHNIPPLMDQSLFEVSQILAINNTDPSIIKSLSNQISDPQKKQELVTALFDIKRADEKEKEVMLKNIALQNPGIKELIMEKIMANKEVILEKSVEEMIENLVEGNVEKVTDIVISLKKDYNGEIIAKKIFEKIGELSKDPKFLEIMEKLKNPEVHKNLLSIIKQLEEGEKTGIPSTVTKAKESLWKSIGDMSLYGALISVIALLLLIIKIGSSLTPDASQKGKK